MKYHIAISALLLAAGSASAILFYATGDPSYNTNAPTGTLTNSGWQFQGFFSENMGTPIGPHHFITAQHISIGKNVGTKFSYNGETFTTTAKTNDASSDFTIWTVAERFSSYAPLYSGASEVGKGIVVFGRGVDRGVAVTNILGGTAIITNGWKWGSNNYTQRWGTNKVSSTTTVNGFPVLKVDWDSGAGTNECMLADKDSSGGVFIQDSGVWKLAGINYTVGPAPAYSFNSDGSGSFNAAILDFRGDNPLYRQNGINWVPLSGSTKSSFYSSRISSRYSWITNNVEDFDQDVDGLPDWWERTYTNNATSVVASADMDNDKFSNYLEYVADTNPMNPASFFEMRGFLVSDTETVFFNGSTARQYQVFYTTNDLAAANLTWIAAHTNKVWGAGTNSSITVTNAGNTAFYRLWVNLP